MWWQELTSAHPPQQLSKQHLAQSVRNAHLKAGVVDVGGSTVWQKEVMKPHAKYLIVHQPTYWIMHT